MSLKKLTLLLFKDANHLELAYQFHQLSMLKTKWNNLVKVLLHSRLNLNLIQFKLVSWFMTYQTI